ncbi:hypothetical protein EUAN_22240 [Andreesenia angusta]|uniref:DUF2634 domain-containing protein n=1 Tax=Andreesenia angusta TaxID=39480 RepID=A0A1S1V4I5_9FIRM|nr:DUF2634 domain-containing protein [Andreesenia angusta]OHW61374.1 hypothetical protein EUAN_22240 [Andreesenia angusta]
MSIFPFTDPVELVDEVKELPMAREWAWDFEKLDFKTKNGKMYKVEGNEAVKIWIWKLLNTQRYRYMIFSWDYGHEMEDLIGKYTRGFTESEAERLVKEAVESNLSDYVLEMKDFDIQLVEDTLSVAFTAITPYGEVRNYV